MTALSYIVCNYTTSGHTDVWTIYVLYIYIYIYIYTFLYSVFITNAIKMYETHISSDWYSTVVVLLQEESLFQIVGM